MIHLSIAVRPNALRVSGVGLHALVRPDTVIDMNMTGLHFDNSVFGMFTSLYRSDYVPTLLAGHGLRIFCGDTFNLSTMSSFTVTRIAGDHTIFV
jgi:hypothetical protein